MPLPRISSRGWVLSGRRRYETFNRFAPALFPVVLFLFLQQRPKNLPARAAPLASAAVENEVVELNLFLHENTPRQWTLVYGIHRLRAFVRVQAQWFLPCTVGVFYFGTGLFAAIYETGMTFSDALMFGGGAGFFALLGMHFLWNWISARLYPWLDSHAQSQAAIRRGYRLPARPVSDLPEVVLGECHPERSYEASGAYELQYAIDEKYSPTPELSVLSAQSLATGLLVLGSTGTGKTAFVLRPSVFKIFHHPSHPGGLVMDCKASLVAPLLSEMADAGREADVLPIGPKRPTKWNPLHVPLSDAATIAESLMTAIENLNGAPYGADSRWIRNGSGQLAEGAIGLLRLRSGYVTAYSLRMFFGELIARTAGTDDPGAQALALITALFSGCSPNPAELEHFSGLVVSRMSEDEKFRGIYLSELLALLTPLTAPAVREKFNAPADELNMPSWAEAINQGLVVVLDCNASAAPGLAVILGMLLKLGYENAMLSRLEWQKEGKCNADRFMSLVIDEYQDFTSPGDASYLSLCRESKSFSVFMTQGYPSIVQKVGEEIAKVILQSLRNRLILTQECPDFPAELLGQHEVLEATRSIQESNPDATLHASGRFAGDSSVSESISFQNTRKHIVPPEMLATLPVGQGILQSHDGRRPVPIHRVFLRPYFAPPGSRHADREEAK